MYNFGRILFIVENYMSHLITYFLIMETFQPEEVITPQTTESTAIDNVQLKDDEADKNEVLTTESIIEKLKEISETDCADIAADTVTRLKQSFYTIHNEEIKKQKADFIEQGGKEEEFQPQDDPDEQTVKELIALIKEKKAAHRASVEAMQLRSYERKLDIISELNKLAGDADTVNLHYQKVKDLQNEFKTLGEVPPQHTTEIWKAYQEAVEKFYDQWKVNKELRDYDFKKNLVEKQLLLDEATRLNDHQDIIFAFRRLQELHDKWREIGPVAKDVREELWNSFKNASGEINRKYQAFFEERKAKEKENEEAKNNICLRIEQLDFEAPKSYAEWDAMTEIILKAQEEWKQLGYASRKVNNALFARFRALCDDFFTRKTAFFKKMKAELAENLAKKNELVEKAIQLSESEDWKKTTDKIIALQKEWKNIGPVPRKHSDAVWKKFITACDNFFDRKKKAIGNTKMTEQSNLAIKKEIISRLKEISEFQNSDNKDAIIEEIHTLRHRWQETGHVPFKEKDKIQEEYRTIVSELFDKYDLKGNNARMENFEAEIDKFAGDSTKLNKERDRLTRIYDQKLSEIKTYENNLGFLNATSKSGGNILRDMENKIQRLREELDQIAKKITFIDTKL